MSNTYVAFIPASYEFNTRVKIGNSIITFIQKRSKSRRGVGGKKFKNYEDNYVRTIEFKQNNKSKVNPNLTLTGEMLDDIKILDASRSGQITIGFRDKNSDKKSVWMREKGYNFLGLSNSELQGILTGFTPPNPAQILDASFLSRTDGN